MSLELSAHFFVDHELLELLFFCFIEPRRYSFLLSFFCRRFGQSDYFIIMSGWYIFTDAITMTLTLDLFFSFTLCAPSFSFFLFSIKPENLSAVWCKQCYFQTHLKWLLWLIQHEKKMPAKKSKGKMRMRQCVCACERVYELNKWIPRFLSTKGFTRWKNLQWYLWA